MKCTTCQIQNPTYAWTTHASFFYGFGVGTGVIEPGLRAWLTVAGLPTYSTTGDDSGAQFVLEPAVNARFPLNEDRSMAIKGGLGVIVPVAETVRAYTLDAAYASSAESRLGSITPGKLADLIRIAGDAFIEKRASDKTLTFLRRNPQK